MAEPITTISQTGRMIKIRSENIEGVKPKTLDFSQFQEGYVNLTLNNVKNSDLDLKMPQYGKKPEKDWNSNHPSQMMGSGVRLGNLQDSTVHFAGSDNVDSLYLGDPDATFKPDFKGSKVSINLGKPFTEKSKTYYRPDEAQDYIWVNPGFQGTLDIHHSDEKDMLTLAGDWAMKVVQPEGTHRSWDKVHQYTSPKGGTVNVPLNDNNGLMVNTGTAKFQVKKPVQP